MNCGDCAKFSCNDKPVDNDEFAKVVKHFTEYGACVDSYAGLQYLGLNPEGSDEKGLHYLKSHDGFIFKLGSKTYKLKIEEI